MCRPANREELYNLHHASAQNVVECIFGILKCRFVILSHPPEYDMQIQASIPPALGAVHNFIQDHDPNEICDFNESDHMPMEMYGQLAEGPANKTE